MNKPYPINLYPGQGITWLDNGIKYCIHAEQATLPQNPIEYLDDIQIAAWHKSIDIGNVTTKGITPLEFWENLAVKYKEPLLDADKPSDYINPLTEKKHLACWPLWIYQHSGIDLRCQDNNPFTCPYDSGQIGWVIVAYNENTDYDTWKEKTKTLIDEILKAYTAYLNGELIDYQLLSKDTNQFDAKWNTIEWYPEYYDIDILTNHLLEQLDESIAASLQTAIQTRTYHMGNIPITTIVTYDYDNIK